MSLAVLFLLQLSNVVVAFSPLQSNHGSIRCISNNGALPKAFTCMDSGRNEVDVSDLGLTMDDLNAPLPAEFFQSIETTGYESTSRIPSVQDDACMWTEEQSRIKVTLAIPGLRGQPPAALAVEFATNTVSITAFGQVVWSAILRGDVVPDSLKYETFDGADMIPVIEIEIQKKAPYERWGGFILQIGENSIL